MQHYDDNYGTRMIDVTTSLYCALFFASADWDGTVDSSVDGKLYMFPHPPGRGETDFPDRHRGQLIGYSHLAPRIRRRNKKKLAGKSAGSRQYIFYSNRTGS